MRAILNASHCVEVVRIMKTTSSLLHPGVLLATVLNATGFSAVATEANPVSQSWATRVHEPTNSVFHVGGISVASSGDVFVSGSTRHQVGWNHDIVVSRYSVSGTLSWQTRYESEEGSAPNDVALGTVAQGTNVYVAGTTTGTNGVQRFLTLKYGDNGELQWARYYGGPAYIDRGTALAVDGLGNAIVAGDSIGTNGSLNVVVVKYSPAGDLLWTYSYDSPEHLSERVTSLKLDDLGNAHIAGTSLGGASAPSVFTLKLNSAGQELWVAREESSVGLNLTGLDVDSAGNVAAVANERSHCVTWKYDAHGNRRWTARYRAEEPVSMYASSVRFDNQGNIVVGGNLNFYHTVLIKYDPDGQQQWVTRIAHPSDSVYLQGLDVDEAGHWYVISSPTSDVVTYKVGPDGAQLWSTAYDSGGFLNDFGQFLEVMPSGDILVGVRSYYSNQPFVSLVKYTQHAQPGVVTAVVTPALHVVDPGTPSVVFTAGITGDGPVHFQWRKNGRAIPGANSAMLTLTDVQVAHRGDYSVVVSNSVGMTVSAEARLSVRTPPEVTAAPTQAVGYLGTEVAFVAAVTGNDFVTLQWRHNGTSIPGATNEVLRLASLNAADGGAYDVVATTFGGTATSSAAGLRISSAVNAVETTGHQSASSTWEYAPQLRVLPSGEFLIAARSNHLAGSSIILHKHGADGDLLWSAAFESADFTNAEPSNLGLDAAGNIYVTGLSRQPYLPAALAVLKFNPEGQLLWSRLQAESNWWYGIHPFAVDASGSSSVGILSESRMTVTRYNSAGDLEWSFEDSSPDNDTMAMAVDSSGNTYLGTTIRAGGYNEIRLRKFDSTGAVAWIRPYAEGVHTRLGAITVDSAGNLIVAGLGSPPEVTDGHLFVAKYSPAGQKLWETRTGSSWSEIASIVAIAAGPGDEITVLTESDDDYEPGERSGLTRVGANGQFRYRIGEPQILVSRMSQLALDPFGNAYITGFGGRHGTGVDAATAKYDAYGNRPWLVYHDGPGIESWDYGIALGADASGDIRVLASEGFGSGSSADFSVVQYRQRDPASTFRVQLIRDGAGTYHLGVPAGETLQIEASTDLQNWSAVTESEAQQLLQPGGMSFSSSSQRFFRLVLTE